MRGDSNVINLRPLFPFYV